MWAKAPKGFPARRKRAARVDRGMGYIMGTKQVTERAHE